jgi:hypothetical protein
MRVRAILSTLGFGLVTSFVVVACTAGVVNPIVGFSEGGVPPTGDGGCVNPVEGDPCTQGQATCSSGGDICCIGYAWACETRNGTSTWQKENVGCACQVGFDSGIKDAAPHDAGPVYCGGKACVSNQFCLTGYGGAAPPEGGTNVSYSCTQIPPACIANPTCACLMANGGTNGCQCSDATGFPAVTCYYP